MFDFLRIIEKQLGSKNKIKHIPGQQQEAIISPHTAKSLSAQKPSVGRWAVNKMKKHGGCSLKIVNFYNVLHNT